MSMQVSVSSVPAATLEVREIRQGQSLADFLDVVRTIYRDDPAYVEPLRFEISERLNAKRNPFFEHAEVARFVAYHHGRPVGRITAQIDRLHLQRYQDGVGFFGFLDTIESADVASLLLSHAEAWLRARQIQVARGPFSLGINEETGCLVDGFATPPSVMMPHHRPYQAALIEQAGYRKAKDFYAWNFALEAPHPRMVRAQSMMRAQAEVEMRPLAMRNFSSEIRTCVDIFNDAWSDNWGFVPLSEHEAAKMAADLKLLLIPEFTRMVLIDGEPAAFAIGLPNLNALITDLRGRLLPLGWMKLLFRLKFRPPQSGRLVLLGVRKRYRQVRKYAPLALHLIAAMNEAGRAFGIRHAELSWTLEDNFAINAALRGIGAQRYKTYRVFEKRLA
jgi:hypothetical protein